MDRFDANASIRRKLMIDSRGTAKGVLKGFYYTRDWDEAHRVCDCLKGLMADNIKYEFSVKVKRGCSEFQYEHPDYNTLDENGELVMKCPDSWKEIERDFYSHRNFPIFTPKTKNHELGLTLADAFVIRNWVNTRCSKGHNDFNFEMPSTDEIATTASHEPTDYNNNLLPIIDGDST